MGVKDAERVLLDTAKTYAETNEHEPLLSAAIAYGKAKIAAWRSRDNWKARKRLGPSRE